MRVKILKIITVGSKGLDQIKREYGKFIIKKFSFKDKKQISFYDAEIVGREIIIELFEKNEFDRCFLFYNKFKNVITQIPQSQQIIPAKNQSMMRKRRKILYSMNLNLMKMKFWKIYFLKIFQLKYLKHF